MRTIFLCLLLSFFCDLGYSQKVTYYDEFGYILKRGNKNKAAFHQSCIKMEDAVICKKYTHSNQLLHEITYTNLKATTKNGTATYWYRNGNKKKSGSFLQNQKTGIWLYYAMNGDLQRKTEYQAGKKIATEEVYYSNGQLKRLSNYQDGKLEGISKTWTQEGLLLTEVPYQKGAINGTFISYYSNGNPLRKDQYKQGTITDQKCYTNDGRDTLWFPYMIAPLFPGCKEKTKELDQQKSCAETKMLQFVYQNIKYPPKARKYGAEGTVVINFLVGKDGSISDIAVLKSVSGDIDEECLRIVKMFPKFIPAKVDGKNNEVPFNLPIKFRLH